jgi:hypothetical protein
MPVKFLLDKNNTHDKYLASVLIQKKVFYIFKKIASPV